MLKTEMKKNAVCPANKKAARYRIALFWFFVVLETVWTNTAPVAKKTRTATITPTAGTPVAVVVNKNIASYFICSQKEPLEFSVKGPGTLEVTTRLLLPKGKTGGGYTVELREGNKLLERHQTQTQEAAAKLSGRSEAPGKSRSFHYQLPEDEHHLMLVFITGDFPEVVARFTLISLKKNGEYVAIAPLAFARTATALIKEKQFTYYVATPGQPVQFRVFGPVRLKTVSRLSYDERIKGPQKYTVTVSEGKELVNQFPLETTKSTSAIFSDWPEVVPGKGRTFYVDVPSGEHLYNFDLTESVAKGVALLFSLPKAALSNGR